MYCFDGLIVLLARVFPGFMLIWGSYWEAWPIDLYIFMTINSSTVDSESEKIPKFWLDHLGPWFEYSNHITWVNMTCKYFIGNLNQNGISDINIMLINPSRWNHKPALMYTVSEPVSANKFRILHIRFALWLYNLWIISN